MKNQMLMNELGVLMFIMAPNPYMAAMKIEYVDEVNREVRRESGQGMFNISGSALEAGNTRFYALAALRETGLPEFVAGLYVEETESICFKGMLVAERLRQRGFAGQLVRAVQRVESSHQSRKRLVATVRQLPCGRIVLGSLRAFEGCFFKVMRTGVHQLKHDDADGHLSASQERDGSVRFLTVEYMARSADNMGSGRGGNK